MLGTPWHTYDRSTIQRGMFTSVSSMPDRNSHVSWMIQMARVWDTIRRRGIEVQRFPQSQVSSLPKIGKFRRTAEHIAWQSTDN